MQTKRLISRKFSWFFVHSSFCLSLFYFIFLVEHIFHITILYFSSTEISYLFHEPTCKCRGMVSFDQNLLYNLSC